MFSSCSLWIFKRHFSAVSKRFSTLLLECVFVVSDAEIVFTRANKIAKDLNKPLEELTIQDIKSEEGFEEKMAKILFDSSHEKDNAEREYMEIYSSHAFKDADLDILSLISNNKTEFLQIYNYNWEFIRYCLKLDDSDIIWIKEILFDYLICLDEFVHNVNSYNKFLYEIINILNKNEDTYKNNSNMLIDLDKFLNIVNNLKEDIIFMTNFEKIIWVMLPLFSQIHDYIAGEVLDNNQCLAIDCMQKMIEKS